LVELLLLFFTIKLEKIDGPVARQSRLLEKKETKENRTKEKKKKDTDSMERSDDGESGT